MEINKLNQALEIKKGVDDQNQFIRNTHFDRLLKVLEQYSINNIKQDKKRLRRLENNQKRAFELLVKKHYPSYYNEWLELFDMFFKDLLAGNVKNMLNWLEQYTS